MKTFIQLLSVMMMVGLIIGIYFYQKQDQGTLLQLNHSKRIAKNNQSPNEQVQPRPDLLQPINNDDISYSLQNNELNMTYNKGENWIKVPIEKDLLFNGEYMGNKQELIDGSYILTENRAAFLYKQGAILVKYSLNQGKTWQDGVVTDSFPDMRFRKVDFLNNQFGYVIISGDRTMSQEFSIAFLTHDGGKTWEETTVPPTTRLIADGGFLDETTGFLSYGTINPEEPDLYITQDGGNTWSEAVVRIPDRYDKVFVQAEIPIKEGDHLSVLVNQGPNGDYQGGKVKGKFLSNDNGLTWEFSMEVQPDDTKEGDTN